MCSPADASLSPSRMTAHGSGPMRFATLSSYRTCTDYSLPVSRRTAKNSGQYPLVPASHDSVSRSRAQRQNHTVIPVARTCFNSLLASGKTEHRLPRPIMLDPLRSSHSLGSVFKFFLHYYFPFYALLYATMER
jgi:hypothetical protein